MFQEISFLIYGGIAVALGLNILWFSTASIPQNQLETIEKAASSPLARALLSFSVLNLLPNMKIYLLLIISLLISDSMNVQFDFGAAKDGKEWNVVNDGVMGGLSEGEVNFTKNSMQFFGQISLENNGGFSSVKGPFRNFELAGVRQLAIRYRSSGQLVSVTLENNPRFYYPYYKLSLPSTGGEWKAVKFDIAAFEQYRLGQVVERSISDDFLASVIRIGFITGTKKAGAFEFEVDYLRLE